MAQALSSNRVLTSLSLKGTQFTCFTSTKVQILTPEELQTAPLVLKALRKSRRCS
jgi:hypothetical protein